MRFAMLVLGLLLPCTHSYAEANISVNSIPYLGWELEVPYAGGKHATVKPNSKTGRQIAASAEFYSLSFCKKWYGNLNPASAAYIKQAKQSNSKEFARFYQNIKRAVAQFRIAKNFDSCVLLTSPYQSGGDAAQVMPWGAEGYYPEDEE